MLAVQSPQRELTLCDSRLSFPPFSNSSLVKKEENHRCREAMRNAVPNGPWLVADFEAAGRAETRRPRWEPNTPTPILWIANKSYIKMSSKNASADVVPVRSIAHLGMIYLQFRGQDWRVWFPPETELATVQPTHSRLGRPAIERQRSCGDWPALFFYRQSLAERASPTRGDTEKKKEALRGKRSRRQRRHNLAEPLSFSTPTFSLPGVCPGHLPTRPRNSTDVVATGQPMGLRPNVDRL